MKCRTLCSAVCVVLFAVAGCGGRGDTATTGSESPISVVDTVADPSQLTLVGSGWYDVREMAVDGDGMVWIRGPWQVTRLDPATGEATTWDAADDLAFATTQAIAASHTAGVWLLSSDRVRLFDGDRFVIDVAVPDEYLDETWGPGMSGAVEDGSALWITTYDGWLARWADGSWTTPAEGRGGPLAVAADGFLWAGGCRWTTTLECSLSRFDGAGWSLPGDPAGSPQGEIWGIVADPSGGVWVLTKISLHHFDGATWQEVTALPALGEVIGPSTLALAVDGSVWVAGERSVGRLSPDGGWTTFGAADGLSEGYRRVAAVGGEVVVSTGDGTFRFDGTRFERLWTDTAAVPAGWSSGVLAVSHDEVWTRTWGGSPGWWRYHDGSWAAVGPHEPSELGPGDAVLAPDGSVWAITPGGLVRFEGEQWTVMDASMTMGRLAAGPDGTVWEVGGEGGGILGFRADGTSTFIGPPTGDAFPSWGINWLGAGPDGVVWAASGGWAPAALARWDGEWQTVPLPVAEPMLGDLLVARDGALWVAGVAPGGTLFVSRYVDGGWTTFDLIGAWQLAQAPDGSVCATSSSGLVCFDESGEVTGRSSHVLYNFGEFDIAPDGAIWVHGDQFARMPDGTLP